MFISSACRSLGSRHRGVIRTVLSTKRVPTNVRVFNNTKAIVNTVGE